jgi:hypothetical protein
MRAWKVTPIQGKPIDLEMHLNKMQTAGFEIFDIINGSFGYTIISYIDETPAS